VSGVFDGHGGAKVSKFIKQTLHSNFLQLMPENKSKWTDEIVYSGLKEAVKKVDFEVTKIRKWDRQGSTVAAVFINKSESESEGGGESNSDNERDSEGSLNDSKEDYHSDDDVENEDGNEEEVRAVKRPVGMKSYSILTVNVGDSRVVLARSRRAIDLTSDHKPNLRYAVRTIVLPTSK
jgi:serine/threonine protein phosphatase PrpC